MTYSGFIKDGVAVLDPPINLPDGTQVHVEVATQNSEFWNSKNIEELAREQGIQLTTDQPDIAVDWPVEDSIEDLLAMVREVRH